MFWFVYSFLKYRKKKPRISHQLDNISYTIQTHNEVHDRNIISGRKIPSRDCEKKKEHVMVKPKIIRKSARPPSKCQSNHWETIETALINWSQTTVFGRRTFRIAAYRVKMYIFVFSTQRKGDLWGEIKIKNIFLRRFRLIPIIQIAIFSTPRATFEKKKKKNPIKSRRKRLWLPKCFIQPRLPPPPPRQHCTARLQMPTRVVFRIALFRTCTAKTIESINICYAELPPVHLNRISYSYIPLYFYIYIKRINYLRPRGADFSIGRFLGHRV